MESSHDPDFFNKYDKIVNYDGASLRAMVKLGKSKGYSLIGTVNSNAFFVLKELIKNDLREIILPESIDSKDIPKHLAKYKWEEV